MVDRRPALIARCTTPADVAAAIRHARDAGLEIGVKCGGHGILGLAVPDAGLMIDLSPMGEVRVDPARRRAAVQGGASAPSIDRPIGTAWPRRRATCHIRASAGSPSVAAWAGWPAARAGVRQRRGIHGRDGRRRDGPRERDGASGPVLGSARWGRQLRCRHRVRVPAPPDDRPGAFGRVLLRPVRSRGHRRRPGLARPAALGATRGDPDLRHDHGGRAAVPAGATPRPPGRHRRLRVGRRHGRGSGLPRAVPPDRHAAGRGDRRDALRRPAEQRRRAAPPWPSALLGRPLPDRVQRHGDRCLPGAWDRTGRSDPDWATMPGGGFQAYGGAIAEVGDDDSAFSHRDTLLEFFAGSSWADPAEDDARMAGARRWAASMEAFSSGTYVNVISDPGEEGVSGLRLRAARPARRAETYLGSRQCLPPEPEHQAGAGRRLARRRPRVA